MPLEPIVSVLMPIRDAAGTAPRAVASVQAWRGLGLELVLVNDGSGDATHRLLDDIARRDPRVRVIHRPAEGLVPALNAGLAACRGRYIARMDADDLAHPERLERQVPLLEADPGLVLVDGQVRFFRDEGEVPRGMQLHEAWINGVIEAEDFERALSVESPVVHPAATFRRAPVLALGGYRRWGGDGVEPAGPLPEDYDLWLRLHEQGWRFRKVPEVLVHMRDRPERLTRTHPAYSRQAFRRARALWLAKRLAAPQRLVVWGAGKAGKPWIRWAMAAGHQLIAVVDIDPKKIGSVRQGVPVVPPDALPGLGAEGCLVAVGARGARARIRAALTQLRPDWREGRELLFLC